MKKRVLLDIDGVVLNLVEGVRILLERDGITFYPENVVSYNFNGDIGCEKTKVYAKFNDPELYKVMPFMDSSKRLWIYLRDTVMYMHIQQLLIIQKLLKCVNNSLINLA